ncbi:HGGxSTG domain-containing protein [Nitrolancea hollandica]|uniref:HGGxSTG domain-containing protein n=1 Tax=Nitrolancea hollandica TaxID=1206749 RepID=UPI001930A075|nr:HGGxSTG domain-containing protein [Nitrolancea hollandica]
MVNQPADDPKLLRALRLLDRLEGQMMRRPAGPVSERPPRAERPRCGAKTRRGTPCQAPANWPKGSPQPRNGRCRMHGGLSTGPKTQEGKAAIASNRRRRNASLAV